MTLFFAIVGIIAVWIIVGAILSRGHDFGSPSVDGGSFDLADRPKLEPIEWPETKPAASTEVDPGPSAPSPETRPKPAPRPQRRPMTAKAKGDAFEKFFVRKLNKDGVRLLAWRSDKAVMGCDDDGRRHLIYAEENKDPDMKLSVTRDNGRDFELFVECKFRSRWSGEYLDLGDCVTRYKEYGRRERRKVLIALGVGPDPAHPAEFMLVPVQSFSDTGISRLKANEFAVDPSAETVGDFLRRFIEQSLSAKSPARSAGRKGTHDPQL